MFDTFTSFFLGTLLGACLTLLVLSVNNKRKASKAAELAAAPAPETITPIVEETVFVDDDVTEAAPETVPETAPEENAYVENNANHNTALEELDVPEGQIALDFTPAETIEAVEAVEAGYSFEDIEYIENILVREAHLENEWIEAERIEADRVESELIEAVRLEALQLDAVTLAANRLEIDRLEADRVEADRVEADRLEADRLEAEQVDTEQLEQEFAALQAAERVAENAAKEMARLDVEQAQKRAAEESARLAAEHAAAREQQHLQEEDDRLRAESEALQQAQQEAQQQADRLAAETALSLTASTAAPAKKISRNPPEILIMVADDSKVVRVKTSRVLTKHAYQIALAEDGNDAASQIDFIMPDLLITDVEMPGMDGFALTRHLRANPITAHLPIIMISGASDELVDKAKQAGIDVLLGKPYSEEDLIKHIRRLVQSE